MSFSIHFKKAVLGTVLAGMAGIAGLATLPATTAHAQVAAQPGNEIVLSIGRGKLVSLPANMSDLFIANDQIADVQVKSQRQMYVYGKSGGETTLYASNAAGDIIYSATVRVGSNIDSIDQMLALAMPEAKINVATMNGIVLLTGTIAAPADGEEAERLVQAFVGEETQVVSRLKTATPLQVNLQVKIAEVSRSLLKNVGANLQTFDPTSGFQFGVTNGRGAATTFVGPATSATRPPTGFGFTEAADGTSLVTGVDTGTTLAAIGRLFGIDVVGALDLAETIGLVTTLSQPNLTALSGETAEFLAGGEFPIPLAQGLGTTTIEFRNFGVSLSYTPTVLANGRISMRVRPEVSELSSAGSVSVNGFTIPGLTIRRAETTVELGSGQSFMIAGLLSNNSQNTVTKAPGLGDVPILGNLFKSTSFQNGETELVIIVTPYLVKPVNGNDIKLPTDGFQAANDAQRFLLNQQTDGVTGGDRPKPTVRDNGNPQPDLGSLGAQPKALPPRKAEAKPERSAAADPKAKPGFSF